jgi:peptidoglycan/LPS O-acetylase OafA/YrhL
MPEDLIVPETSRALSVDKPAESFALPSGSPSVHLDALRGFAAFSVLLNHWHDAFYLDYHDLSHPNAALTVAYLVASLGYQWVIIFFVMSGYLVGGSVIRSMDSGRWSWRRYLLARLTRLYLVLIPALLLGGVLDWTGMHLAGTESVYSGQSGMHALTTDVHTSLTLPALAANGLFLQTIALPGMGGRRVPTFGSNGPLWSLSNEFWYYLAFPILALLLAKAHSWRARVAYGMVLAAWGLFVGGSIAWLGIPWLMGVLIVYLPRFQPKRVWTRNLSIAAALALLVCGLGLSKAFHSLAADLVLGLAVMLLIWVTLNCATSPLPALYVRAAQRAARSSYTLYLVHLPLLIFLKASLHIPRALPGWHTFMVSGAVLVVILLYSQLVYQMCEKNTDKVRNLISSRVLGSSRA